MCSLIICICDRAVPLLPGRIPDLQFDFSVAVVKRLEPEVNSDGGTVVLNEVVISESYQDARLPYTRVSKQN